MKEVLMVVTLGMDPTRPSILYAGTSGGVYKSIDRGRSLGEGEQWIGAT